MDDSNEPRSWTGELVTIVTICVISASGILLNILPFLLVQHHGPNFFLTVSTAQEWTLVTIGIFAVMIIMCLEIKRRRLHDHGQVLWPFRCQHCLRLLTKVEKYRKDAFKCNRGNSILCSHGVDRFKNNHQIYISPIHKSTLQVTNIFAILILCFLALKLISSAVCVYDIFNSDDSRLISTSYSQKVAKDIALNTLRLAGIYIVQFHFMHDFFDAYIIALPLLGWLFGLAAAASVWIALWGFVDPFMVIVTQQTPIQPSHQNTAFEGFVNSAAEICEPLFMEFPVMIAWLMIQIWLRALPRQYFYIIREITGQDTHREGGLASGSAANTSDELYRTDIQNRLPKCITEQSVLLEHDCTPDYGSIDTDQDLSKVLDRNLPQQRSKRDGSSHKSRDSGVSESKKQRNFRSKKLPWKVELCFALSIVMAGVYFGMSDFILVGGFHNYSKATERGRFTQWIVRFVVFLPSIVFMLIQMKVTKNRDGSFVSKRRNHDIDHVSERYLFLILSTGASMYEVSCFFASLCNLLSVVELQGDKLRLNFVSIVSCVYGIFRVNLETVFLLNVQNQKLQPGLQTEWTLVCLVNIGVINVAQWLWDSMIHKVTSPLAWPVLVTCFGQEVGGVIGMTLAPLSHLYELHAALFALEIFKIIRSQTDI